MNRILTTDTSLTSYLDQAAEVRARFGRLKARDVLLEVRHLDKVFRTREKETLALSDINFSTHRREFLSTSVSPGPARAPAAACSVGEPPLA